MDDGYLAGGRGPGPGGILGLSERELADRRRAAEREAPQKGLLGAIDPIARGLLDGVPAWRLITSTDRAERLLLYAVIERADRIAHERMEAQAVHVVNALAKATED